MIVTHDSSLDPTAFTPAIDEPFSIELENPAQEVALSFDIADPSPIDLERSISVIQQVLDIVNRERGQAGLSPLRLQSQLTAAAQEHSNDMARNNFLNHTGSDGSSPFDRIKRHGYNFRRAAENIAVGYSSPEDVMRGWMKSNGHRKNILNSNYRDIGIGSAPGNQPYWTQTFGG